jgi:F-type H+-transporting ATPase subunit alpha
MAIRPDEITSILKNRIENFVPAAQTDETGTVISVGDGIARIYGLSNAVSGEMLAFESGVKGLVLNLEYDNVGCVLLGEDSKVKEGEIVKRTGKVISVPVGKALLGRVVNPLGEALDGKAAPVTDEMRPMDVVAPGVVERQPVKQPLQTGLKAIDAMVPIGKGQRELIIGDRQTGKTAVAIDAIINQKQQGEGVICIYVAIGQKQSTVAQVVQTLTDAGAMPYTIVVAATASDPASLLYIAPYAATAMGEYFMWEGKDVLIVYDDLSKHAQAYRQMSLLLRRPPGREAYPGDVFYLHSRLLERSCKLSDKNGAGSMTALPIIETQANDISAYIPTNVISITDGQIYLDTNIFRAGNKPAIDVGLSVSRVGGSAQKKAMRAVSGTLRIDLAQYQELESFAQFGSELDRESQLQLARGIRMKELLKQPQYRPMKTEEQILSLFAGTNGFMDDIPVNKILEYESEMLKYARAAEPKLFEEIAVSAQMTDELKGKIKTFLENFKPMFKENNK